MGPGTDLHRIDLANRNLICLRCGLVEKLTSNLSGELLAVMDSFRERHTTCSLDTTPPTQSLGSVEKLTDPFDCPGCIAPAHTNHNDSHKFRAGDVVEYCGEQATVIANYGTSGVVEIEGQGRMSWYWKFDGADVTLVKAVQG